MFFALDSSPSSYKRHNISSRKRLRPECMFRISAKRRSIFTKCIPALLDIVYANANSTVASSDRILAMNKLAKHFSYHVAADSGLVQEQMGTAVLGGIGAPIPWKPVITCRGSGPSTKPDGGNCLKQEECERSP